MPVATKTTTARNANARLVRAASDLANELAVATLCGSAKPVPNAAESSTGKHKSNCWVTNENGKNCAHDKSNGGDSDMKGALLISHHNSLLCCCGKLVML
jgi:hypothetical protein